MYVYILDHSGSPQNQNIRGGSGLQAPEIFAQGGGSEDRVLLLMPSTHYGDDDLNPALPIIRNIPQLP